MSETGQTPALVRTRLSVMMFLQYAIWGAWLPLLWPFLNGHRGFNPGQIGDMFAVGAVGALVAPFVAGQIADRLFATEKFLGISHILGGIVVFVLASTEGYWAFLGLSLLYSLIYSPTLSLTNSISFHHLPDRDRDFGKVRVWGTVGWICVGIGIGQWLLLTSTPAKDDAARAALVAHLDTAEERAELLAPLPPTAEDETTETPPLRWWDLAASEETRPAVRALIDGLGENATRAEVEAAVDQLSDAEAVVSVKLIEDQTLSVQQAGMINAFRLSAILGIVMGLFCFTLPHTPPSKGREKNAAFEAIGEVLRSRPLMVLFLLLVPVSCIHQFYFVHTSGFLGTYQTKAAESINAIFGVGGGGLMTIGQMSEILVLALMPLLLKKVGHKTLLAIGLVAYALRMALFAYVDQITASTGIPAIAVLITGVTMHGLCFGCFIFVSFVVVDKFTSKDVRASAQSLFSLVIFGIGIIVGSKIAGMVAEIATKNKELDYQTLFAVPMWGAIGCLVALLLFYPRRDLKAAKEGVYLPDEPDPDRTEA